MEMENNVDSVKHSTRKRAVLLVYALFFVSAVSVPLSVIWFRDRVAANLADFSALWNTTDALEQHLVTNKEWPDNWDELGPSLAYVDPRYRGGDLSSAGKHHQHHSGPPGRNAGRRPVGLLAPVEEPALGGPELLPIRLVLPFLRR